MNIDTNRKRDRRIFARYINNDYITMKEVGKEYGLSPSRIAAIVSSEEGIYKYKVKAAIFSITTFIETLQTELRESLPLCKHTRFRLTHSVNAGKNYYWLKCHNCNVNFGCDLPDILKD